VERAFSFLARVESAAYESASEVVGAALRILERETQEYEARLATCRTTTDEGGASGVAEDDSFRTCGRR